MAIIKTLPGIRIINGFKGKVDFYVYMGLNVARAWPKSPGKNRSAAVKAQWPTWTYIGKAWRELPATIKEAYTLQAAGTPLTGRDLFTRGYIKGLYMYPTGT